MLIIETFCVNVPIRKLYHFFLDAENVGSSIPGCEGVQIVGENEYDSVIKTKVGIISAVFKVRTSISEKLPFNLIRTVGHGKEIRNLGQFRHKTKITLKELSESETEVSYEADVTIVGRLATFGDRIIKSKAKAMGKEFVESIIAKLNPEGLCGVNNFQEVEGSQKEEKSKLAKIIKATTSKIRATFKRVFQLLKFSNKPT
jgi:uncharacterized protein